MNHNVNLGTHEFDDDERRPVPSTNGSRRSEAETGFDDLDLDLSGDMVWHGCPNFD